MDVMEVRRTDDGWYGRWQDPLARATTVELFGGEWLPLPFTSAATLADLVSFYADANVPTVAATVVPAPCEDDPQAGPTEYNENVAR